MVVLIIILFPSCLCEIKKDLCLIKNLIWKSSPIVIALWILRHINFYPMGIYLSLSRRLFGYKLCENHIKSTNTKTLSIDNSVKISQSFLGLCIGMQRL